MAILWLILGWREGARTSANITSRNGGDLRLRYANCSAITVNGEVYTIAISTLADTTYYVTPT